MDLSTLNDGSLHHQLIPHRDQSTTYGISSSSSVHPQSFFAEPIFWNQLPPLPPLPPSPPLPPPPPLYPQENHQMAINLPYLPLPQYTHDTQDDSVPPGAREKRHCCQLCTKRFDRPSTLKKHMLVHTGEKAWACEICRRRFSVSSNLNRHTRRCREKWAKADNSAVETHPTSASSSPSDQTVPSPSSTTLADSPDPYRPPSPLLIVRPKRRQQSVPGYDETDDGSRPHDQQHVAGKSYRRRRKGSPTEPWVPASLVNFNLDPVTGSVSTPLPAVVPNPNPIKPEERNSYDNTPLQAYHPSCWTGRLVGPSYAPRREEFSRGRFCGKVLVF